MRHTIPIVFTLALAASTAWAQTAPPTLSKLIPMAGRSRDRRAPRDNSDMALKAVREALELAGWSPARSTCSWSRRRAPSITCPPPPRSCRRSSGCERARHRHPLGLCRGRRGARPRPPVPRARRLQHGRRRGQRGDLAALRAGLPRRRPRKVRMRDRLGIYSFGDGAGAMVLQARGRDDGILGLGARLRRRRRKPGCRSSAAAPTPRSSSSARRSGSWT